MTAEGALVMVTPAPPLTLANQVLCMSATVVLPTAVETSVAADTLDMIILASTMIPPPARALPAKLARLLTGETVRTTSSASLNLLSSAARKPS